MVQAVASVALVDQIEIRVQENTPSSVRASVLSVLSALGRAIAIPVSFMLGWLFTQHDELWALRFVTTFAVITLLYWFWATRNILKANKPALAKVATNL